MSLTFVVNQTLATETCIKCGVLFAMPETWQAEFKRTHQHFMCPAGHAQFYPSGDLRGPVRNGKDVAA